MKAGGHVWGMAKTEKRPRERPEKAAWALVRGTGEPWKVLEKRGGS